MRYQVTPSFNKRKGSRPTFKTIIPPLSKLVSPFSIAVQTANCPIPIQYPVNLP